MTPVRLGWVVSAWATTSRTDAVARVSLSPPRPLSMLSRLRRARKNMCVTVTAKRSVKESGFDFILFRPGNTRIELQGYLNFHIHRLIPLHKVHQDNVKLLNPILPPFFLKKSKKQGMLITLWGLAKGKVRN